MRETRCVFLRSAGTNPANILGTLADFGGQAAGSFAERGTTRRQRFGAHLRAALDRADYRSVIHSISIGHGDETLLRTKAIDHPLLAGAEHGVRKNGKVPEHPEKIYAL